MNKAVLMLFVVGCAAGDASSNDPTLGDGADGADGSDGTDGTDGTDGADGTDGTAGCPSGPLLGLTWADRDVTHALLPGVALTPATGVTTVREERLDEGVDLTVHFNGDSRFDAVTITLIDPATGSVHDVFEDRLLWGADGRPSAEERWRGSSVDALVRMEVVTFTYDADGRRVTGDLVSAGGGTATLTWDWDGDCLVGYDRDGDGSLDGDVLTCTSGERAETWQRADGGPALRYRWPDDPAAAAGPDGVNHLSGDTETEAESWKWTDNGFLESTEAADGRLNSYVTDADGTLASVEREALDGSTATPIRWTVGCD